MSKQYFEKYISQDGDRWDTLAYDFYNDASLMTLLIEDNAHLPTTPIIEAASIIYIREDLPKIENNINNNNLPPWRQL